MRRRLTRWGKWGGLAATLLLAAVWVGSARWGMLLFPTQGAGVGVVAGSLRIGWGGMPAARYGGFGPRRHVLPFEWWSFRIERYGSAPTWLVVPLWAPCSVVACATGVLWWRDRGGRAQGCCARCGYSLRGLDEASACPECGGSGAGG